MNRDVDCDEETDYSVETRLNTSGARKRRVRWKHGTESEFATARTGIKQLILVRHAKSSWQDRTLSDRDRPLNSRGKRDAPEMGDRLARRRYRLDRIVSSPAVRALETARTIAEKLGYARGSIAVEERLYGAAVADLLDVIRCVDESVATLMLFGHNPGLTELANHLGPRPIPNLPTCGVLHLGFETDTWSAVGYARGAEVLFDFPKSQG